MKNLAAQRACSSGAEPRGRGAHASRESGSPLPIRAGTRPGSSGAGVSTECAPSRPARSAAANRMPKWSESPTDPKCCRSLRLRGHPPYPGPSYAGAEGPGRRLRRAPSPIRVHPPSPTNKGVSSALASAYVAHVGSCEVLVFRRPFRSFRGLTQPLRRSPSRAGIRGPRHRSNGLFVRSAPRPQAA